MNLGKSLSFSESESDKYLLDFLKEEAMIGVYFFIGPMLYHPPWSPTCVGNKPGGKIIHPGFDRDTLPSSSSSYRAGSTDIPDPLSPLIPIVHRPR